jgi:hypothetical protein
MQIQEKKSKEKKNQIDIKNDKINDFKYSILLLFLYL